MFDAVEKALIPQVFSKEMGGQPEIADLCFAGTPRPLCMFPSKYAAVIIAVQEATE